MSNVLNLVSEDTYVDQTDEIVEAINGFGSGLLAHARGVSFSNEKLPETIDVTVITFAPDMLDFTTNIKSATITALGTSPLTLNEFASASSVENIVFKKLPLAIMVGVFNLDNDNLTSVIFPPNVIKATTGTAIFSGELIDESLVSIGNALKRKTGSGSTGNIKFSSSTVQSRLNTLMGTVTDGVFTQDNEGTVTLYDFITQTKGWTVV